LNLDYKIPDSLEKLIEESKFVSTIADIPREGIVIRSHSGNPKSITGNFFSFKVINPDFILKYQDKDEL